MKSSRDGVLSRERKMALISCALIVLLAIAFLGIIAVAITGLGYRDSPHPTSIEYYAALVQVWIFVIFRFYCLLWFVTIPSTLFFVYALILDFKLRRRQKYLRHDTQNQKA